MERMVYVLLVGIGALRQVTSPLSAARSPGTNASYATGGTPRGE
jgi:hypothetical protein